MPSSTISSKLALHGKVARIWGHPGSNTEEPPWSGHFRHEGIWKEISCFAFSELRKRRNFCLHPWEQHWTAIPCLTLESWQHPWDSEVVSLSGQCSQHWPRVAGSPMSTPRQRKQDERPGVHCIIKAGWTEMQSDRGGPHSTRRQQMDEDRQARFWGERVTECSKGASEALGCLFAERGFHTRLRERISGC